MTDRPRALALPQTSFADGAALSVHAALLGDLDVDAEVVMVPEGTPLEVLAAQADAVRVRVAESEGLVVVAAECTLAGAVVAGLRQRHPDVNLVWLDAHADLNTPATSASGLLVGMALAAAMGQGLPELLGDTPPERVVLFGARAFDPAERALIDSLGLTLADSASAVLDALPPGPVHLHLDGDVFDPADEPNAPFPIPDGPSAADVARFVAEIAARRPVLGVSVCGYASPDAERSTAYRTVLNAALGRPVVGDGDVRLIPLAPEHAEPLRRIRRTPEVERWWDPPEPDFPLEDEPEATRFVVTHEDRVVGMAQYGEELEPKYRSASIDVFIDPAVHGRGIGTTAVRLVAEHLVRDRGHHRLQIDPAAHNTAAIRCYEKAGFTPVGILRLAERDAYAHDRWHDVLLMELVIPPAVG